MPKRGNTKNRKKIWISTGVERMNSTKPPVIVLTQGLSARRSSASTRPRTAASAKPSKVASIVTTAARASSGRISSAKPQSNSIMPAPCRGRAAPRRSSARMQKVITSAMPR